MSSPTPERPSRPEGVNNGQIDRAAAAFAAASRPRRPGQNGRPAPGVEGNGPVRNPNLDINIRELKGSTQRAQYSDALRDKMLDAINESRQSGERIRLENVDPEDIVKIHSLLLHKLGGVRGFSESLKKDRTYLIKPVFEVKPMDPDYEKKFDRFGRPRDSESDDGKDWRELGAEHGRRERRRRGGLISRRIGGGNGRRNLLRGMLGFALGMGGAVAAAEAGWIPGTPQGTLAKMFRSENPVAQAGGPPEQPRHEVPGKLPEPVVPDNGETSPRLPDPARKPPAPPEQPKPAEVAPPPSPVPNPEVAPVKPLIVDRRENVTGKSEVPAAAGNDAWKTLRKFLNPKYQGRLNPASGATDDENMRFLIGGAHRRIYGELNTELGNEQKKSFAEAPEYYFSHMERLFPELKNTLYPAVVILDYPSNDNLTPSRLTMNGSLPLRDLQVASTIEPGNVDGMTVDEVPLDQVANAFGEVVSMDFINPSGFEPKLEGNRWRATGTQKSDGAKVEIVCARDGRFSVRITQSSYKERPGETPQLRVPQIPR